MSHIRRIVMLIFYFRIFNYRLFLTGNKMKLFLQTFFLHKVYLLTIFVFDILPLGQGNLQEDNCKK